MRCERVGSVEALAIEIGMRIARSPPSPMRRSSPAPTGRSWPHARTPRSRLLRAKPTSRDRQEVHAGVTCGRRCTPQDRQRLYATHLIPSIRRMGLRDARNHPTVTCGRHGAQEGRRASKLNICSCVDVFQATAGAASSHGSSQELTRGPRSVATGKCRTAASCASALATLPCSRQCAHHGNCGALAPALCMRDSPACRTRHRKTGRGTRPQKDRRAPGSSR